MPARSHARPEPMPRQDEKSFHRQVVELARYMGFTVWHDQATNAPRVCWSCKAPARGQRNASGLPDLLLVGILLALAGLLWLAWLWGSESLPRVVERGEDEG